MKAVGVILLVLGAFCDVFGSSYPDFAPGHQYKRIHSQVNSPVESELEKIMTEFGQGQNPGETCFQLAIMKKFIELMTTMKSCSDVSPVSPVARTNKSSEPVGAEEVSTEEPEPESQSGREHGAEEEQMLSKPKTSPCGVTITVIRSGPLPDGLNQDGYHMQMIPPASSDVTNANNPTEQQNIVPVRIGE